MRGRERRFGAVFGVGTLAGSQVGPQGRGSVVVRRRLQGYLNCKKQSP